MNFCCLNVPFEKAIAKATVRGLHHGVKIHWFGAQYFPTETQYIVALILQCTCLISEFINCENEPSLGQVLTWTPISWWRLEENLSVGILLSSAIDIWPVDVWLWRSRTQVKPPTCTYRYDYIRELWTPIHGVKAAASRLLCCRDLIRGPHAIPAIIGEGKYIWLVGEGVTRSNCYQRKPDFCG